MKGKFTTSVFLKGFFAVLIGSFAITYVWMYVESRRKQVDDSKMADLKILESNYEREKVSVEGFIARADAALADLDSQPRTKLTEPDLIRCYKIKYALSGPAGEPIQQPIEVSRDLDQDCAEKQYELARTQAIELEKAIADKRAEIVSTKTDLEEHLSDIRSKFNSERVHILNEEQRRASKDSFVTKFPLVFGAISMLSFVGIYCTQTLLRRKAF
jgi:hypothetical protein